MYSTGHEGLDTEVRLRLSSPADVISAVPYLLGFHPRDSLVLVSLHGGPDRRISLASRIDLPPPAHAREAAVQLAQIVVGQGCDEVLIAVVGGGAGSDVSPPRADVVAAMRMAFEDHRVGVPVAVWAPEVNTGAPWRCYDSGLEGILPDPETSAVAAATVAAGHVTYSGRGELEALVAPGDPSALERRSRLLDAHCDRMCALDAPEEPDAGADAFALVQAWVGRAAEDRLELGDDDVVSLCLALSDPIVRDAAFGLVVGSPAQAERLWTALVRAAPAPEAAEPAVLLAHSALVRGNGALVSIALERAQRAWPGHRMSELFLVSLDRGLGREELCEWFADGAAEARLLLRRCDGR
jgi:hypothetical protein